MKFVKTYILLYCFLYCCFCLGCLFGEVVLSDEFTTIALSHNDVSLTFMKILDVLPFIGVMTTFVGFVVFTIFSSDEEIRAFAYRLGILIVIGGSAIIAISMILCWKLYGILVLSNFFTLPMVVICWLGTIFSMFLIHKINIYYSD